MAVASHLMRPTRGSDAPGRVSLLTWPCSDRGLPCRACCQARGGLLPLLFTLTLWRKGRSVFCGPFRRLAAPRRYLAVCPTELGLSSARPSSRRTATIAPYRLPRGKLLTGRVGASLPHQAPQQARQAVRGEPPAGRPHAAARRHRRVGVE